MDNQLQEPAVAYNRHYTPEEYLNMEWENGQRYEYWDGNLVAMAGASLRHGTIALNIAAKIKSLTRGKGCMTYMTDAYLMLKKPLAYLFPDVVFTCHPDDLAAERFIHHPTMIIEILSDSTEVYDRTRKWDEYRKIKSLRHYLLVSQHAYRVEMFSRTSEHGLFFQQVFEGLEDIITFTDLGFEVSLAEVYEGISLPIKREDEDKKK